MNHRAYSLLEVKQVRDDQRIIIGMATTPSPDRMGDIVEPLGVKFKNPLPLLWHHDSSNPVGEVRFKKPGKDGIEFEARIPRVTEPGPLKDRLDTAWGEVKHGLVKGVSIGFRDLESSIMKDGGIRFIETEVLELSLVTIPANAEATIDAIKSIDTELLAASGRGQERVEKTSAGVTASKATRVVKAKTMGTKSIADRIREFETKRAENETRMSEIEDGADSRGETFTKEEKDEWDGLDVENKEIDEHLGRLRAREQREKTAAVPIDGIKSQEDASKARQGVRVKVKGPQLPPGIAFTRYAIAKYIGARDQRDTVQVAKERWPDMPELEVMLKAAVNPGTITDSTWAGPLAPLALASSEFIEYLWPRTVVGRIPGLTRVPFRIKVPRQTAVAAVNWVGENKPKPLGSGAFDTVELAHHKIAGIVALTDELVRHSSPSAETLTRNMLANGIVKLMDQDFLDPDKAAVANVSPASLTNGVTPTVATGTAYSNFVTDFKTVMAVYDGLEIADDIVVVMHTGLARSMGLMLNALAQPVFPGLGQDGGTMMGFPVVTSTNIQYTEDSAAEGSPIIFIHAPSILLADDGQVSIDVSREASVQMDSAPTDPPTASTVLISFWQMNLTGFRAERAVTWLKARTGAVQFISAAKYA